MQPVFACRAKIDKIEGKAKQITEFLFSFPRYNLSSPAGQSFSTCKVGRHTKNSPEVVGAGLVPACRQEVGARW